MDVEATLDESVLSSVEDYVVAIQSIGSGRFMSRFQEDGQRFFAGFFGAPIFAMTRLAPEVFELPDSSVLMISADSTYAMDGGRWITLFARAQESPHKPSLTICIPSKPERGRPPKPLLLQLPQQILVKDWRRHLEALDVPPDVLAFQYVGFDNLLAATDIFCRHVPGRKLLVFFSALQEALIGRQLLASHGFAPGELINFPMSDDKQQHFAPGAWWLSSTVPSEGSTVSVDQNDVESLRFAALSFELLLAKSKDMKAKELIASVYASRATESIENEDAVHVVRIVPTEGISLATGRFYSMVPRDSGALSWAKDALSAKLVEQVPAETQGQTQNDDRLALMIWLGKAFVEIGSIESSRKADQDTEYVTEAELDEDLVQFESVDAPPIQSSNTNETIATGASAESVAAQPHSPEPRLSRSAGTVNVLAMAAMLGKNGVNPEIAFQESRRLVLEWLANKSFSSLDAFKNQHVESSCGEVTIETDGHSIWAMRFDDRQSMGNGAIWRVEITLMKEQSSAISVRMAQIRSNEDAPAPVASGSPSVVAKIAKQVGMHDVGFALVDVAQKLKGSKDARLIANLLLNQNRCRPVIVISGEVDQSADRLAKRLAGIAYVVRIDRVLADTLIRSFGRDRSVYGNAVRLYRPGFTVNCDYSGHPVWALKGTALPKWLADDVFEQACAISLEFGDLEHRAPSFQAIRSSLADIRQQESESRLHELKREAESISTSAEESIGRLKAINQELESALGEQKAQNTHLVQQVTELESELQATIRERNAAREEVRQLKFQIGSQWSEIQTVYEEREDQVEYPETWDVLETWVELYGKDRLVLHPKAAKAARESPFKDIPLAYKAMDYLVRFYIPMRTRSADDYMARQRSLEVLAELGLEESDVGTADEIKRYKHEYRRKYDDREVTLDRHLKRGVGFGADHQFRLYFYYDENAGKVLVGHMPTHLTNRLSH